MKCLVTGGAGFIGSHITDGLIRAGHEVIVVDNLSTGNREQINGQARFEKADIGDPVLDEVFSNGEIEVVFHLAAQTDVMTSVEQPHDDAMVNIVDGIRVLELCRKHGVRKVVYSSSSAIFGEPAYLPMDEKHAIRPMCPYAASKQAFELYLDIYREIHGLAYTVHVDDLVAANLACLKAGDNECFNLGTGREITINEIVEMLNVASGRSASPTYKEGRKGEMRQLSIESGKAREGLDWTPHVGIKDGLKTVVNFFKDNPNGKL
jgi:UDP-glucose 4-epimerase